MKTLLSLRIPGLPVSGNRRTRFRGNVVYTTREARTWMEATCQLVRMEKLASWTPLTPMQVQVTFFCHHPATFDIERYVNCLLDAVTAGLLAPADAGRRPPDHWIFIEEFQKTGIPPEGEEFTFVVVQELTNKESSNG